MPLAANLSKKTWSSPSNTRICGSKVGRSTEVKVQNVEGEEVGDPRKQWSGAAAANARCGDRYNIGSGATENAQPQAGASARPPFRLKVGTKMA